MTDPNAKPNAPLTPYTDAEIADARAMLADDKRPAVGVGSARRLLATIDALRAALAARDEALAVAREALLECIKSAEAAQEATTALDYNGAGLQRRDSGRRD